jgi:hypothetical protein
METVPRSLVGFVMLAACALPACEASTREYATIEGRVTLGPIMPVCREGVPCDGVFAGAQVVVRHKNGGTVAQTKADANGMFRVEVPAGAYIVSVAVDAPLPHCSEAEVVIAARQNARVEIDCDSGIR